jgi:hypothetical protein
MADNRKTKNTRNQESQLFKQLTKLFSGPLASYNQQTQSRYRRTQLDKFKFQSAQGLEFKKAEYLAYENISTKTMHAQNRADRYIDFDQMEYMPEIASALDIYADEMTTNNELTAMLKVKCPNEEIKSILETLYFKTLNLESNLFSWSRNMCKYGDFFLYLDIDDKLGVTSGIGLPSNQIERMEGKDKTNSNYVQFQWNSGGLTFENWQIAHFRILGNDKHSPYGTSVLDPAELAKDLYQADIVIGALKPKNGITPIVVSEDMVSNMKSGSVIVDVIIDCGGCVETSEITTHEHPTFKKYDVVHYCVPNIPSGVARTASNSISNILMPLILECSKLGGCDGMVYHKKGLRHGVYLYKGTLTSSSLGKKFNIKHTDIELIITSLYNYSSKSKDIEIILLSEIPKYHWKLIY